jgi:hypothetical protein
VTPLQAFRPELGSILIAGNGAPGHAGFEKASPAFSLSGFRIYFWLIESESRFFVECLFYGLQRGAGKKVLLT